MIALRSRSPVIFFLLVFALSIPFGFIRAVTRLQLLPGLPLRVMRRRRGADLAQFHKFVESLDQQYRVQVLLSVGRVGVKVAHPNVAGSYRPRQHAIRRVGKTGIPLLDFRVKRVIGLQSQCR